MQLSWFLHQKHPTILRIVTVLRLKSFSNPIFDHSTDTNVPGLYTHSVSNPNSRPHCALKVPFSSWLKFYNIRICTKCPNMWSWWGITYRKYLGIISDSTQMREGVKVEKKSVIIVTLWRDDDSKWTQDIFVMVHFILFINQIYFRFYINHNGWQYRKCLTFYSILIFLWFLVFLMTSICRQSQSIVLWQRWRFAFHPPSSS